MANKEAPYIAQGSFIIVKGQGLTSVCLLDIEIMDPAGSDLSAGDREHICNFFGPEVALSMAFKLDVALAERFLGSLPLISLEKEAAFVHQAILLSKGFVGTGVSWTRTSEIQEP